MATFNKLTSFSMKGVDRYHDSYHHDLLRHDYASVFGELTFVGSGQDGNPQSFLPEGRLPELSQATDVTFLQGFCNAYYPTLLVHLFVPRYCSDIAPHDLH